MPLLIDDLPAIIRWFDYRWSFRLYHHELCKWLFNLAVIRRITGEKLFESPLIKRRFATSLKIIIRLHSRLFVFSELIKRLLRNNAKIIYLCVVTSYVMRWPKLGFCRSWQKIICVQTGKNMFQTNMFCLNSYSVK